MVGDKRAGGPAACLVVLAVGVTAFVACGQSNDRAPPYGAGGTVASGGGSGGDSYCWAKSNPEACYPCCQSEHPDGPEAWFDAMIPCVCEAAHCGATCEKSICASPVGFADEPCFDCLTDALSPGGACEAAFAAACEADPKCKAIEQCEDGCW